MISGRGDMTAEKLRQIMPELTLHQSVVAEILLVPSRERRSAVLPIAASDVVASWDEAWFGEPGLLRGIEPGRAGGPSPRHTVAKRVLERIVSGLLDESTGEVGGEGTAYFAALRGDRAGCEAHLGRAGGAFLERLLEFATASWRHEAALLLEMAGGIRATAAAAGFVDAELEATIERMQRALEKDDTAAIDLESTTADLGEAESRTYARIEDEKASAESLLAELGRRDPPQRRDVEKCLAFGRQVLDDRRYATAALAFRLVVEAEQAQSDSDAEHRVTDFLVQHGAVEDPAEIVRLVSAKQAIARLSRDLDAAREASFDVAAAAGALARANAALSSSAEEAEVAIAEVRNLLIRPRLLDEPIGFSARFPSPQGSSAQGLEIPQRIRAYREAAANPARLGEAIAVLRELAAPLSSSKGAPARGLLAEWVRIQALQDAYVGDFGAARRCCEDLFFLLRRWGREIDKSTTQFPKPPSDVLIAVHLLIAVSILECVPAGQRATNAAEWLAKQAQGTPAPSEDNIRKALSCAAVDVPRMLFIAWGVHPSLGAREIVGSLHRMSRWEEAPGWLGNALASLLREQVIAWRTLGYLLVAYLGTAPEWTLDLLDHLAGAGRGAGDLPAHDRQHWSTIRRGLATFARSTGTGRSTQHIQLLGLLVKADHIAISRPLKALFEGIRESLREMEVASDPPELVPTMEETYAVVDGSFVEFALALENRGHEVVHSIVITSQSESQIVLGGDEAEGVVIEPVVSPGQTHIERIRGTLRGVDEAESATLGLRISFRGHNDRAWERPLSTVVPLRVRERIRTIDPTVLVNLFNDSGNSVTSVGKNFFGRTAELAELEARTLNTDSPAAFFIAGMRRIGKTSLAKVFLERVEEGGHVPSYVNFEEFTGTGRGGISPIAQFRTFAFLAQRILESKAKGDGRPLHELLGFHGFDWWETLYAKFNASHAPAQLLRRMLSEVSQHLPAGVMVVVVIDELDYFVDYWNLAETRQDVYDFFNVLRSLKGETTGPLSRFRWLLSGSDRCAGMFNEYSLPLYGNIASLVVKPMHREECDQLLRGPFERLPGRPIAFSGPALAEVHKLTGGFPFFVQIIGNRLCGVLRDHGAELISRWHVRQAVQRSLPDGIAPAPYDRILEPIGERAENRRRMGERDAPLLKYVLALIAHLTADEEPRVKLEDVVRQSEVLLGARLSRRDVMGHALALEKYNFIWIETEGDRIHYRIRFPLLRLLVQKKYDYSLSVMTDNAVKHLEGNER